MSQIKFKEIDVSGEYTLDVISDAHWFNKWMYDTIRPYCKGNVIEIGSGIGNISKYFLEDGWNITLSDIRDNYCARLSQNFGNYANLKGIYNLDIVARDFDEKYQNLFNRFDTLFALNVIEHIEDDVLFVHNCKKLLKDDGHIVILAPAYQLLYNKLDIELDHFRRYNRASLSEVLRMNSFKIIDSFYFNLGGIPGWFLSGKVNKTIPKWQMSLYNLLVPFFKIADKLTFNRIGLSVICVGKK
jgi:2-polyprenyl-3-methyl-5-hydroxy-6-metoxy-1,4-benzoquinol methylase